MVKLNWHNDAKKDSIYYSLKTINDIVSLLDNLSLLPYMGRKIPEYNEENNRELIYKSYRLMYEIESNRVVIHRIWHSARKLPKQLIS